VQPNGAKWWRLKYRLGGKEKLLSVGVYPGTGLKLARSKRDEARKSLAAGVDPGAERKSRKDALNASQNTQQLLVRGEPLPGSFEAVAREWWVKVHCTNVSPNHAARTLTRMEQDAFPWIGGTPIAMLKAADVLRCAQRVVERGAIETAHRLKDACGQVFRYGVAKNLCERDPVPDLKDALPTAVTLEQFTIKAYVMDDERIKAGGSLLTDQYFEEQLQRVREIRISERKSYQKITDIYATAIDYDVTAQATKRFFATVQNKLHWAIHGQTAAEVVYQRADADQPNMGLTTWKDAPLGKIQKFDVVVAKNYLTESDGTPGTDGG